MLSRIEMLSIKDHSLPGPEIYVLMNATNIRRMVRDIYKNRDSNSRSTERKKKGQFDRPTTTASVGNLKIKYSTKDSA